MTLSKLFTIAVAATILVYAQASTPMPQGASFDVGFSPRQGSLEVVLKGIESAKKQILVAAYSFTSKPIAGALLDAHKRGVHVMVVADEKDNQKGYSATTFLANAGVPVRLDGNYAIHHHKFMVIDGTSVELGSFNYSAAAVDKNAENVLLIWNAPALADTYARQWQKLWSESSDVKRRY